MSLLICEDDPIIAMDLADEARRRAIGHVTIVETSTEALRAIDGGSFDAAIVDLHLLDGRSGPLIARRLAERGIRTIILSGGELDCAELADAVHVFIRKPTPSDIVIDCAVRAPA